MDTILNEMGSVWQTLGKAEQVALAEKVAGVRQYTQLIALMDNWEYFQKNLTAAYGSEGALQEQANIYAESWEAARDRVTAAAETIYEKLLDDDAFIGLLNSAEKILEFIDDIIDSVGGLKGVFLGLGALLTNLLGKQMQEGFSNIWMNFKQNTKSFKKQMLDLKKSGVAELNRMARVQDSSGNSMATKAAAKDQLYYLSISSQLTDEHKKQLELQLDLNKQVHDRMIEAEKTKQEIEAQNKLYREQNDINEILEGVNTKRRNSGKEEIDLSVIDRATAQNKAKEGLSSDIFNFDEASFKMMGSKQQKEYLNGLITQIDEFKQNVEDLDVGEEELFSADFLEKLDTVKQKFQEIANGAENVRDALKEAQGDLNEEITKTNEQAEAEASKVQENVKGYGKNKRNKLLQEVANRKVEAGAQADFIISKTASDQMSDNLKEEGDRLFGEDKNIKDISQSFTSAAQGAMSLSFGIQSITNAWEILNSSDSSGFEKILTFTSSISMGLPQVISGLKNLKEAYQFLNTQLIENGAQMLTNLKIKATDLGATIASTGAKVKDIITNKIHRAALWEDTKATIANTAAKVANLAVSNPLALAIAAVAAVVAVAVVAYKKYNEEAKKAEEAAKEADKLAEGYENVKSSYDSLLSTISAYDEAVNSFEKLTKGTDEWAIALDKANDEAMQLLKTYKNLKWDIDDNGLIVIDQNGLQQQKEESRNQMLNAQSASRQANNRAEELQLKADQTKLKRDKLDSNAIGSKDSWDKANTGAKIGTAVLGTAGAIALGAVGSIIGPVGTAIGAAAGAVIGNAVGAVVGGTIGGLVGLGTGNATKSEQEALDKIATRYEEIGNALFASKDGFREELKNLGITDERLIDSLVENMDAVQENTQALALNKKSNIETTKNDIRQVHETQIKNANLSDKDEDFVLEVVAEKTNKRAEELKNTDEYSHWNIKGSTNYDKKTDFAERYAEAMGYTIASDISGDSKTVSFKDAEGNEVNDVDFDTIERYLAYQQAVEESNTTLDDYIKKERELEKIEANLSNGRVTSATEYEANLEKLIEKGKELGFTEEQITKHYKNSEYASQAAASSTIADSLMTGVFGSELEGKSDEEKEQIKKYVQSFTDNLTAGMDDQEIQVAISAAADARTMDEFSRLLADGLLQATVDGLEASMDIISTKIANEDGVSISDLLDLQDDENFVAYLESTNQQMSDIISGNYSERKAIATDYYNWLENQSNQTYQQQIDQYQRDLAEWQAILDYKKAEENGDNATKQALIGNFENIDFEAYMDIDISEAESKIDEISGKIDDISNKQIEVALDWSGIDNITNSFKEAGEFVNLIEQDAKKVGKTYQLTANQAREWAEVYPEIFAEAETTTDGMISLTEEDVEAFKKAQETKRDENIDTEIASIESQERELEAKIEAIDADIALAEANATGKADLEKASAEYLAETRSKLTDYFIECGLDEAEANTQALQAMGLSQAEYAELIAKKSKENSENTQKSILEPLKKLKQILDNAYANISNFASAIWKKIKNPGEAFDFSWTSIFDGVNSDIQTGGDTEDTGIKNHYTSADQVTDADRELALDSVNNKIIESLKSSKAAAQQALAALGAKKVMAQAQKDQDISSFSGSDKKDEDSDKDKDEEETLSSEAERYHEIDRELKNISRELDRIEKKKDKAFGGKKLALMDQELETLNEELDATGEKIEEAKKNLTSDQAKLNYFGATYNDQGEVTNYDELYAQEESIYNTAMASGDEDAIEAAKERWEYFKEVFSQYEDTLDTLKDTQDEEQEIIDKIAEEKLAKIQYELELKVNVIDMSEEWVDYQLSKLDDKAFSSAEKIAQWTQQNELAMQKSDAYLTEINDIFKNKGMSKTDIEKALAGDQKTLDKYDFTADEIEEMKTVYSALLEENQTLIENKKQIEAELANSFNEYTEAIEKNIETIGKYADTLDKYRDIIDLVGADRLGLTDDFVNQVSKNSIDISKKQIAAQQAELEGTQKSLAEAREKLSQATTEEDIKFWEGEVQRLEEKEMDCQQSVLDSVSSTLQKLKELYEKQIDDIFDKLEKQVAGRYGDLDTLNEAYERQKTLDEQTLPTYKKIYELNKLNSEISKKADETNNVKAKKALRDLQAEIAEYQKDGVEMSEYQLNYLQKEYDLELAKIALEDAQNAKSQVRLTRDASGNYGYTYTADADKVADAQQNYNDALYAVQDLTETYLQEQNDLYIQYSIEFTQAMQQIWSDYNQGLIDAEQRDQRLVDTQVYYENLMSGITSNIQLGLDNNRQLYDENAAYFSMVNDGMKLSWDSFTTKFDQTALGQTIGAAIGPDGTLEGWFNILKDAVQTAMAECKNAVTDYEKQQNSILQQAGLDIENFGNTVVNYMGQAATKTNELRDSTKDMAEKMPGDYKKVADAVAKYQKKWNSKIQKIIKKNEELAESYKNIIEQLSEKYEDPNNKTTNTIETIETTTKITKYVTQGKPGGDVVSSTTTSTTTTNTITTNGDGKEDYLVVDCSNFNQKNAMATMKVLKSYGFKDDGKNKVKIKLSSVYDLLGTTKTHKTQDLNDSALSVIKRFGFKADPIVNPLNSKVTGYITKFPTEIKTAKAMGEIKKFDTGGYTGRWNTSEGKMAMLHEKELVLNKDDTKNMLSAVSVVREIVDKTAKVSYQAKKVSTSENDLISELKNSLRELQLAQLKSQLQDLNQKVQIQAEFPNVTNHLEVEQALNSLVNKASQYAYRQK